MSDDRIAAALAHYASIGHDRSNPDDPAPADYPSEVEAALGIALPPDYRRFLATYPCAGGPDACVVSPIIAGDAGATTSILEFDGFVSGGADLIERNRSPHDFAIPGMLVIGDDAGGNPLYLDLVSGEVWFCDLVDTRPGQREGLALVGTDFADFLLRMEIDPAGDLVPQPRPLTLWQRVLDWITP